jgi:hypothetical protein
MKDFKKTDKQIKAVDLMTRYIEVLLEGGSRSGKTFIEIYAIIARCAKYPGSKHIVVRKHFNHAKLSLWHQTIPAVLTKCFPDYKYKENKTDWYYEFSNGSQLWIGGTDDKERVEKILGTEWSTILLNEISEQSYETYELLKTRLNPDSGMKPLMLFDQNPPKKSHWSFLKFHLGLNPETKQPLSDEEKERQVFYKMNPFDNKDNLNPEYLKILNGLSERKKKRFLYGEYGDDTEGALWKTEWITANRIKQKPDCSRVVVAIDPNVTDDKKVNSTTDEAGIITVGEYKINGEKHYVVIRDDSTPGLSWGAKACDVYEQEQADRIIAETNNGGDLVEMNIRNYNQRVSYESVRASRGKEVRAEPIADLYRRGYVHHFGEFPELEDELTSWVPGEGRSPNRLDALVWGITYLSGSVQGRVIQKTGW